MDGRQSVALGGGATADGALSFISERWREVRDSADADLRLIRARATSFESLADRELENFLHSPSPAFALPSPSSASASIQELEFVKRIQPKLSEIRRAYSSPDFSLKVLEKWTPKATLRIDLSAIRDAIVAEADDSRAVLDVDKEKARSQRKVQWKGNEEDEEVGKEWDPFRKLKTGSKEFDRKSQSNDILGNFKSSQFVEKVKLSLVRNTSF